MKKVGQFKKLLLMPKINSAVDRLYYHLHKSAQVFYFVRSGALLYSDRNVVTESHVSEILFLICSLTPFYFLLFLFQSSFGVKMSIIKIPILDRLTFRDYQG